MKIHFFTLVWGERYTHYFLEYTLKAFLNALEVLELEHSEATYFICTNPEEALTIRKHPHYKQVCHSMNIHIADLSELVLKEAGKKYGVMSEATKWIIAQSQEAILFYLPPDVLWSQESFQCAIDAIKASNKRVILAPSLRIESQYLSTDILKDTCSQKLISTALLYPHYCTENYFIQSGVKSDWPSFILSHSDDQKGVEGFYFHLHPLAIYNPLLPKCEDTPLILDGAYLETFAMQEDIFIGAQSTDIFGLELTDYAYAPAHFFEAYESREHFVAFWALFNTTKLHRLYMEHTFCLGCIERSTTLDIFKQQVKTLMNAAKEPEYWVACLLQSFLSSLMEYSRIGIYGAGGQGRLLMQLLQETGCKATICFIDDVKEGLYEEKPIMRVSQAVQDVEIIVIASVHFKAMMDRMESNGYEHYTVFPPFLALVPEESIRKGSEKESTIFSPEKKSYVFWKQLAHEGPKTAWDMQWSCP